MTRTPSWLRFLRYIYPWQHSHASASLHPRMEASVDTTPFVSGTREVIIQRRPEDGGPKRLVITAEEWNMVERYNFQGPVGFYYNPDDPEKPEAYTAIGDRDGGLYFQQPDRFQGDEDQDSPPAYEWARVASLPTPVVVKSTWPSLFAAQCEMSQLLETQKYINTRLKELDTSVRTVLQHVNQRSPHFMDQYILAQVVGTTFAAGICEENGPDDEQSVATEDADNYKSDLVKICSLREAW
ncbi:hypothetical protein QBC35DRAFT_256176 [Podospora australis]|uniref:Uncharacterized protein n=1 Tax=Podospora australis TaxID=1536484 RepID=A0AAN7AIA7_9PEZI|nr:hypothetical protein QBC35DRAFT_256176 [Podospora australis]